MHSRLSKIALVCCLCFLPLLVSTATNVTYRKTANKRKNLFPLSLIHINDFHARFEETNEYSNECKSNEICIGGYARIVTVVKELQRTRTNPIYLNAGDSFAGTIWYTFGRWNVTSYFMNLHKADVMTIGNHEFDHGVKGVLPYLETINSPVVLANVDISEEPELQGKFVNSVVLARGGRKIGIIGVLNSLTNETSMTGKIKFLSEVETVRGEAENLKAGGVDIIIVLSHSGLDVDYEIARKAGEHIDVIVGGHTHNFMYTGDNPPGPDKPTDEYPAVVTQANGRKVLIVQASAYAKYVGDLTVYFDEDGDVRKWLGNPIFLGSDVVPDEHILEQMQPWMQQYNAISSSKIANANFVLENGDCYVDECIMGDLLTDIYLKYFQQQNEVMKISMLAKPSIAILQAGSIRTTLQKGPISYADLITVIPFGDTIDTLDIKGKYLWDAFEHSVKRFDPNQSRSGKLLQVSGMRFAINATHPPGNRVLSIEISCAECEIGQYEQIDLERNYRIVASHYMAHGGDGFTMIADNKENYVIGALDIDIVSQHLKSIGEIKEFKKSNRITVFE